MSGKASEAGAAVIRWGPGSTSNSIVPRIGPHRAVTVAVPGASAVYRTSRLPETVPFDADQRRLSGRGG
ncbi:hypothetical protein NOGI109294_11670 [Nocardiopsis gilva]